MADEFGRTSTGEAGAGGLPGEGVTRTSDGVRQDGIKGRAHQLQETARESSRDLLDQAVEKKDELKARASTALDDGRHQVSDRVGSIARALHSTADNLEQDGEQNMSQWVHQAADQVDRVVGYLNGRDAGGLIHDMEDLARRNPALFLGGTYAAGLALGRFLRASSPERRTSADDEHARESRTADGTGPSVADSAWTGAGVSRDDFGAEQAGSAGLGAEQAGSAGLGAEQAGRGGFASGDTVRDGFSANPSGSGPRDTGSDFIAGSARGGTRTDDLASERFGAIAPPGSVPLAGSVDDVGFTDEDLREAWHEREARGESDGMRGASRSDRDVSMQNDESSRDATSAPDLDTGELTRYTSDDRSREG